MRVRPTFQVEGSDRLFAVGDCASLPGMQKAGVYAVRGGPILAENLRRLPEGQPLRVYRPQRDFLSLLNLGDGTAVGVWRGIGFEGRWVMRLKDWIDRRFVERCRCDTESGGASGSPGFALIGALSLAADAGAGAAGEISSREALALIEAGNSPRFVDVRTPKEYASGHVPGAINIPRDQLASRLAWLEDARDRLVVYCERGPRATAAVATLVNAGFTGVRHLKGDMAGWRAPVCRSRSEPAGACSASNARPSHRNRSTLADPRQLDGCLGCPRLVALGP